MTTNHEELICTNCGCIIDHDDEWEHDGEYYCSDCFHDEFYPCECCGDAVHSDDVVSVNDGEFYVCSDCADSNYTRCDHCGDYYTYSHIWAEDSSRAICEACSYHYYVCAECGDIVHEDNAIWRNDEPYCSDYCAPTKAEHIHEYGYKPNWQELRTETDSIDCRTYGVEIEIDDGDDVEACSDALYDANEYIIMKEDGSLSDDGIEIVTHPSSLAFHMNELGWDEITEIAKDHGYKSHDTETCGFHVHIGRDALHEDTADKLVVLVDRLWDQLVIFSRRNYHKLQHWAAKPNSEITAADTPQIRADKLNKVKCNGRYQAVNLCNNSTIEIRIFRGTLKVNTILATLQLVDALCEYCESHTFAECAEAEWEAVTSMCNASELATYLKERGL